MHWLRSVAFVEKEVAVYEMFLHAAFRTRFFLLIGFEILSGCSYSVNYIFERDRGKF